MRKTADNLNNMLIGCNGRMLKTCDRSLQGNTRNRKHELLRHVLQ